MLALNPEVPKDPEKVDRIMKSATHIFAENGYLQAKTADIAKAASVSKGIVFRYFGDKGHLYLATVEYVIEHLTSIADFSVWRDANDLGDMIERAVRYKIELQLQYPDEFTLSVRSFGELGSLPEEIQGEIAELWRNQTTMGMLELEQPVIDRMPIRDDVDRGTLQRLLSAVADQVFGDAQQFMQQHPKAKIKDFEPIIRQIQDEYRILERGFLK